MTRADEYRARAEEADRQAREARDPQAQFTFRLIARRWRELADQMERIGR